MNGLMMDMPLSIPAILRRTALLYGRKEIVSRRPDKTIHRYTYGECIARSARLASALRKLGVEPGDRVATLAWNHGRHLEAYFAIPSMGAVLHTLNLRLHPDDLAYIINHAEDRVLLVDKVLMPILEKLGERIHPRHVIVMSDDGVVPAGMLDYETLLAAEDGASQDFPDIDEQQAAAMCYTSGTTGRPKGVLYSHRALVLHSFGSALANVMGVREHDTILAVVPMFHANAWGLPYTAALIGARQVFPGPHLDAHSLLALFQDEKVTYTAGVPTIWLGILQALDANPKQYDLSSLHTLLCGGAATPESLIRAFQERHRLNVVQAWGMTEMSPLGTMAHLPSALGDADEATRYAYRAKQGIPAPFVEIRARSEDGLVPWDGATMGELEVRGPWVAAAYYNPEGAVTSFTDDHWFRTGDIVTIDANGFIAIQDRSKDVIKSGGEWISSVALENALMGHPDVAEAAVVGVPHAQWTERPLAVVALKEGRTPTPAELRAFLAEKFAKWWIPDTVVFVPAIPKSGTGKFLKTVLRDQFRDQYAGPGTRDAAAATAESDGAPSGA